MALSQVLCSLAVAAILSSKGKTDGRLLGKGSGRMFGSLLKRRGEMTFDGNCNCPKLVIKWYLVKKKRL